MHVAVSSLSPVNIQILIPALRNSSNVGRTRSCKRSSTPFQVETKF